MLVQSEKHFKDTIVSKNKIKKLLILRSIISIYPSAKLSFKIGSISKNVFLSSPFHFKIAKKHLHVPYIHYCLISNVATEASFIGSLSSTANSYQNNFIV